MDSVLHGHVSFLLGISLGVEFLHSVNPSSAKLFFRAECPALLGCDAYNGPHPAYICHCPCFYHNCPDGHGDLCPFTLPCFMGSDVSPSNCEVYIIKIDCK